MSRRLVISSLASVEHALPIASVDELVGYGEPRSIASGIGGVIGRRGTIVPDFDLEAVA